MPFPKFCCQLYLYLVGAVGVFGLDHAQLAGVAQVSHELAEPLAQLVEPLPLGGHHSLAPAQIALGLGPILLQLLPVPLQIRDQSLPVGVLLFLLPVLALQ